MRAWQISAFGIDSLEFVERPTPAPGPGEVLLGVRAVSLNYRDLMVVKGLYNPKMELPRIPCSDARRRSGGSGRGRDRMEAWRSRGRHLYAELAGRAADRAKARGALGGDIDGMLADYVLAQGEGWSRFPIT